MIDLAPDHHESRQTMGTSLKNFRNRQGKAAREAREKAAIASKQPEAGVHPPVKAKPPKADPWRRLMQRLDQDNKRQG